MKERFAKLISIKSLITIVVMSIWAYSVIVGNIQPDSVNSITLIVISFYFGTQVSKASTISKE